MPTFEARLQALNERFAAGLPATLAALAAARARLAPPAPDRAAATELHHTLHTLAGSAATFGYPGLGQYARGVEQELRRLLAEGGDWSGWLERFDAFLNWAQENPRREYL